jgi:hypothetical protein
VLPDLFEAFAHVTAEVHEIFVDDFEPPEGRTFLDDILKVRVPKSRPCTERGKVEVFHMQSVRTLPGSPSASFGYKLTKGIKAISTTAPTTTVISS